MRMHDWNTVMSGCDTYSASHRTVAPPGLVLRRFRAERVGRGIKGVALERCSDLLHPGWRAGEKAEARKDRARVAAGAGLR